MQTELLTQPNNCKPKGGREGWRERGKEEGRRNTRNRSLCRNSVFLLCDNFYGFRVERRPYLEREP